MGQEARCTMTLNGTPREGKVYLETDYLLFRGDIRTRISLADIRKVDAKDGVLHVVAPEADATFNIGPLAEKWAAKIKDPPTVLEKIGVKPGATATLTGAVDPALPRQLAERGVKVVESPKAGSVDAVFFFTNDRDGLRGATTARSLMKPDGALWIIAPKGRQDIKEMDVIQTGRDLGLYDVKVVRYSATHTALKFVVPKTARPEKR